MIRQLHAQAPIPRRQGPIVEVDPKPGRLRKQLWLAVFLLGQVKQGNLESLAAWSDRITPLVSLDANDGLLLEVQGSLKLFGGFNPIKQLLTAELEARGMEFHLCAAPTALGALWLARQAGGDVLSFDHIAASLNPLPLAATRWPDPVLALLRDMGVRSIGDCLRLPRDGFARRVGRHYLEDLDSALGKRADPRAVFEVPRSLSRKIEFSALTEDLAVFAKAAEEMAEYMSVCLRGCQSQLQSLAIVFHHLNAPPTRDALHLVEPVHEKHRLLEPLLARLERIALPAPVIAIELQTDALVALQAETEQLFERGLGSVYDPGPQAELIERLRGRLGEGLVYGLELVAEHRPEFVWNKLTDRLLRDAPYTRPLSPWAHDRPLWLLSIPVPLPAGTARFRYQGPVRVQSEPERIESGWWDGQEVRRDYYAATTSQGERLWVYRDCLTNDWYLHGIFG